MGETVVIRYEVDDTELKGAFATLAKLGAVERELAGGTRVAATAAEKLAIAEQKAAAAAAKLAEAAAKLSAEEQKTAQAAAKLATEELKVAQAAQRAADALAKQGAAAAAAAAKTAEGAKSTEGLSGVMGKLGPAVAGAFSIAAIAGFAKSLFDVTATYQTLRTTLEVTLGSQRKANEKFDELNRLAAATPFSVEDLTGAFIKFANRGLKPTNAELIKLGDLAASQGKGFDQLTEAVLDAATGEFERLKEFGIRGSKAGDSVSLAFKGLNLTMKNSPEAIKDAIVSFGELNGIMGGMERQSQTLGGKMSTLGDSVSQAMEAFTNGTGLTKVFGKSLDAISGLVDKFKSALLDMPVEKVIRTKSEFDALFNTLVNGNLTTQQQVALAGKINSEYGEFLPTLIKVQQQTDAQGKSNLKVVDSQQQLNDKWKEGNKILLNSLLIKLQSQQIEDALSESLAAEARIFQRGLDQQIDAQARFNLREETMTKESERRRAKLKDPAAIAQNIKDLETALAMERKATFTGAQFARADLEKANADDQKIIEDFAKKKAAIEAAGTQLFKRFGVERNDAAEQERLDNIAAEEAAAKKGQGAAKDDSAKRLKILQDRLKAELELRKEQAKADFSVPGINAGAAAERAIDIEFQLRVMEIDASTLSKLDKETAKMAAAAQRDLDKQALTIPIKDGDILAQGMEEYAAFLKEQERLEKEQAENSKRTAADTRANKKKELEQEVKDKEDAEKQKAQLEQAITSEAFKFAADLIGTIGEIAAQANQQEIDDSKAKADEQIAVLQNQLDRGLISQEQFNSRKQGIEEKQHAFEAEKKKEAFESSKALQIIQAVITTAQAVLSGYTSGMALPAPAGPILAGVLAGAAAALGATQIAMIAAQQPPKFAKGGWVTGGIAGQDSVRAMVMPGEFIVQAPIAKRLAPFLEGLNAGRLSPDALAELALHSGRSGGASPQVNVNVAGMDTGRLERALANSNRVVISMDERGFSSHVESAGSRKRVLNTRYTV